MSRKPRTVKTPKQRATEALDAAQRKYDRAWKALRIAAEAHRDAMEVRDAAEVLLGYAKAHPALKDDPQLPLGDES